MIYQLRDITRRVTGYPLAGLLKKSHQVVNHDWYPLKNTMIGRFQSAALESGYRLLKHYPKPDYTLNDTQVDGETKPVEKQVVIETPYADLLRFKHEGSDQAPKVLFVAALSGHYATLGQGTYREFLPDHDVYVTDWKSARDVPASAGKFGFEEYVSFLIEAIEKIGPQTHVVGICQAAVPALVASAVMAQKDNLSRPKSLTLMAGPIDTRVNPQKTMETMAKLLNKNLFNFALHRVPIGYVGEGRKVYPGWAQLGFFVSRNFSEHVRKHWQFFADVFKGNEEEAQKHREFYDEYFATLDGTGEFYLETLERVFFEHHLPEGKMQYHGETVDCSAITDIPLFTIEGGEDDLCLIGTTEVAHSLCGNLPDELRDHHLQPDVGHYGVFNGSKYRDEIAPRMKQFIQQATS